MKFYLNLAALFILFSCSSVQAEREVHIGNNLNLHDNELRNFRIHNTMATPALGTGTTWFRTDKQAVYTWTGSGALRLDNVTPQHIFYVSPTFSGDTPEFASILSAIAAATPETVIIVYPGTYNEAITMKDRVYLYCYPGVIIENADSTTIDFENTAHNTGIYGSANIRNTSSNFYAIRCGPDVGAVIECDIIESSLGAAVNQSGGSLNIRADTIKAATNALTLLSGDMHVNSIVVRSNTASATAIICGGGLQYIKSYAVVGGSGAYGAWCNTGDQMIICERLINGALCAGGEQSITVNRYVTGSLFCGGGTQRVRGHKISNTLCSGGQQYVICNELFEARNDNGTVYINAQEITSQVRNFGGGTPTTYINAQLISGSFTAVVCEAGRMTINADHITSTTTEQTVELTGGTLRIIGAIIANSGSGYALEKSGGMLLLHPSTTFIVNTATYALYANTMQNVKAWGSIFGNAPAFNFNFLSGSYTSSAVFE